MNSGHFLDGASLKIINNKIFLLSSRMLWREIVQTTSIRLVLPMDVCIRILVAVTNELQVETQFSGVTDELRCEIYHICES